MSQKYEKLKTLLQELFQLDQPDLDEDIRVEGLPAGKPSGESQSSSQKWLTGAEQSGR